MRSREVYEHLAQIYLDNAADRKKKSRPQRKLFFKYFLPAISIIIIAGLVFALSSLIRKEEAATKKDFALVIEPGLTRINFDFNLAKKETLSYNLSDSDLRNYKVLSFFARTANPKDKLHLRVELSNKFGELSELYLEDISAKWQDFKVNLADFKKINNWSSLSELKFVLEDWNTKEKKGRVYIDNIRFLK